jgi:hypothetical protein
MDFGALFHSLRCAILGIDECDQGPAQRRREQIKIGRLRRSEHDGETGKVGAVYENVLASLLRNKLNSQKSMTLVVSSMSTEDAHDIPLSVRPPLPCS